MMMNEAKIFCPFCKNESVYLMFHSDDLLKPVGFACINNDFYWEFSDKSELANTMKIELEIINTKCPNQYKEGGED